MTRRRSRSGPVPKAAPCCTCAARGCRSCAAPPEATCTCTSRCARRPGWTRSRSGCCASLPRSATRTSLSRRSRPACSARSATPSGSERGQQRSNDGPRAAPAHRTRRDSAVTPPLFLVEELPDGDEVQLNGDEGRHAARVKRLGVGEPVLVSDGRGALLTCRVRAVTADGLWLSVQQRGAVSAAQPRIVVVQALPKGERAELAVELLTELGADEIVPWAASRSIVQWLGPRGDRALGKWRRTAREATKQSRRAWLPIVAPLASTADVAARLAGAGGPVVPRGGNGPAAFVGARGGRLGAPGGGSGTAGCGGAGGGPGGCCRGRPRGRDRVGRV